MVECDNIAYKPIQAFGGHTHIRDFTVYDSMSTGLESGRYCETGEVDIDFTIRIIGRRH